jgi:hypothetical protein
VFQTRRSPRPSLLQKIQHQDGIRLFTDALVQTEIHNIPSRDRLWKWGLCSAGRRRQFHCVIEAGARNTDTVGEPAAREVLAHSPATGAAHAEMPLISTCPTPPFARETVNPGPVKQQTI